MGDTLAGVAGDDERSLLARIEADESAVVDGVLDLSGPPMQLATEIRKEVTHPGRKREEPSLRIICLPRFVVGQSSWQDRVERAGRRS
jgi:hypothetical protein